MPNGGMRTEQEAFVRKTRSGYEVMFGDRKLAIFGNKQNADDFASGFNLGLREPRNV